MTAITKDQIERAITAMESTGPFDLSPTASVEALT